MSETIHIIPVDDLISHRESRECECIPKVEEHGKLIIHNSYDMRELLEEANVAMDTDE